MSPRCFAMRCDGTGVVWCDVGWTRLRCASVVFRILVLSAGSGAFDQSRNGQQTEQNGKVDQEVYSIRIHRLKEIMNGK